MRYVFSAVVALGLALGVIQLTDPLLFSYLVPIRGTLEYRSGTYTGDIHKRRPSGHGTLDFHNGDQYVGDFNAGAFHGHGAYTFASGALYIGGWQRHKKHGRGTYQLANRELWILEWRQGLPWQGTGYAPNGALIATYTNGLRY